MIKNISLFNTRLYKEKRFEFSDGVNIICGANAKGKTTILEAIYYLIMTRSNRTLSDMDIISYNEDECVIKGSFKTQNKIKNAIVLISKYYKKMSLDGNLIKKATDYVGFSRVISFGTQDVNGISGTPATRRKILDTFICQVDNEYLNLIKDYKIIVNEKNALLKCDDVDDSKLNLLNVLDEKLFYYSQHIDKKRLKFISLINKELNKFVSIISNKQEECNITMIQSIPYGSKETFFSEKRIEDLKYKSSMYGPHKDDYVFNINGKNVVKFGSQGQKKTIALALKMAFAKIIYDVFDEYPIILLDDVFGELDPDRQNNLISLFNNGAQVFITTPSISDINNELLKKSNIIYLEKEENNEPR